MDNEYTVKIIQKVLIHKEDCRWMIAFKMIDSLLSDLLCTVEQKLTLMERQSIVLKKEFGFDEFNAKQFNTKYRGCMKIIDSVIKEKEDLDKPLKRMIADIHKRSIDLPRIIHRGIWKIGCNSLILCSINHKICKFKTPNLWHPKVQYFIGIIRRFQ